MDDAPTLPWRLQRAGTRKARITDPGLLIRHVPILTTMRPPASLDVLHERSFARGVLLVPSVRAIRTDGPVAVEPAPGAAA